MQTLVRMLLFVLMLIAAKPTCTVLAYTPTLARDIIMQASHVPYKTVDASQISAQCTAAITKLTTNTTKVAYVADAMGKPAAGAFVGNWAWLGHYDECKGILQYRYCTVQMQFDGSTVIPGLVLPISWGACAPQECNTSDVNNAIEILTNLANISQYFHPDMTKAAFTVCSEDPPMPYDAGFICVVTLCCVIVLIAILSALFDAARKVKCQKVTSPVLSLQADNFELNHHRDDEDDDDVPLIGSQGNIGNQEVVTEQPGERNIVTSFLKCFSVSSNLLKLLNPKQSDRSILCVNGIRVLSMFWVILGHTFDFSTATQAIENSTSYISFLKRFGFQAILNATFSVDSFFFLSGFLVAFLTLTRMAKSDGKIPWFWFYFHRFWRLTPVYMFTILFFMYITPYFGVGPFWQNVVPSFRPACSKYWWTNLLYINNFWPKNFQEECIAWSWYLANDMQFFIVSPIFIVSLFMFPIVGIVLLNSALVASFITTAIIIWYYKLDVLFSMNVFDPTKQQPKPPLDEQSLVYGKPYCRIAPYLVGIALGYIMYKIGNKKVKMNPIVAAVGWALAAAVAMSILYGNYPSLHGNYTPSLTANIIYGTVTRFAWAVVLAWIVFTCKYGYGGWVNDILSWSGWIVLSRLTYTAYLVHPIVLICFFLNFGTAMHFSVILFSIYFVGCLGVSYGMAATFSLAIEYPFANLEKLFMPRDVQNKRQVESSRSRDKSVQNP